MEYKLKKGKVLVLRTSNADGTASNDFKWPEKGKVTCPDFEPTKECGHGLHGALWGEGDGSLFKWDEDAIWQVVEVNEADIIDLVGKVKFPSGNVIHSGDRLTATNLIMSVRPGVVIGATVTGGSRATVTGGDGATVTIKWWGGSRYRIAIGYVGEDGIEPNTPYIVVDGKLTPKS